MTTTESQELTLEGTEGFVVESTEGDLGLVEEVWVGDADDVGALAVRTTDGRHGLLLSEDVLAVDRDYHWVVVRPEPLLRELDSPRMQTTREGGEGERIAASWATTGEVFRLAPRRRRRHRLFRRRKRPSGAGREPELWRAVAVLLSSIALIVVTVAAVAFIVAWIVTGAAY